MNSQIKTENIPGVADLEFEKLPLSFKKKSVVARLVFSVFLIIPISIVWFLLAEEIIFHLSFALSILLILINIFYPLKSYYYVSYAVRENDIVYNYGVFFRSRVVVPFNRVQHIEIKEGPLDRSFGLAKLVFFTAGGSLSDLYLKGLLKEDAEKIKSFVVSKIGILLEE